MIEKDSRAIIGEYIFLSKYAQVQNGKKESWEEAAGRVMGMHWKQYCGRMDSEKRCLFSKYLERATQMYLQQKILGAQRALQYGGELMTEKPARFYNCTMSHLDRVEFFEEVMYLLLAGCGTGYSVQHRHIKKLPFPEGFNFEISKEKYIIEDSIEGWAGAVGKLMTHYYEGKSDVEFDFSLIRPKGAFIRGGFAAPGSEPLKEALDKVKAILLKIKGRRLTSFELHCIVCIFANSVVTGGVRRSAMLCMFDANDLEMVACKTGNWISDFPELCRSNNSAVILPETSKEVYDKIFESTKILGEPGFVFISNPDFTVNPCCEVTTLPMFIDEEGLSHSGWGFCNLSEINGGKIKTPEDFYAACEAAAIICTLQAGYTDFNVLKSWSKKIADRDALIGVGITGMCENPEILFDPEIQRKGAEIVKNTNKIIAELIGISPAARCTVIKPSGNSSQLLGTLSGITPGHSRNYIRHIQASDTEQMVQLLEKENPDCVEESVWNRGRERVVSFPVTLPSGSILKQNVTAIHFLELVLKTKQNWIEFGTNYDHEESIKFPSLKMNVSNTCIVQTHEWEEVKEFLWNNRNSFGGVSLLSSTGDLDYPQAPFTEVLNENQLAERYGAGAILSSGLVVDSADVFKDVWEACNAAMGFNPGLLSLTDEEVSRFITSNIRNGRFLVDIDGVCFSDVNCVIDYLRRRVEKRLDWVRRFESFADKYMDGDRLKTSYCLKHVNAYHKWQHICKMKPVDYSKIIWNEPLKEAGSEIGTACAGGLCEIK